MTALHSALRLVDSGFAVLPITWRGDAKAPLTRGGLDGATHDPELVRDWFQRWPRANIAIRTGAESDVFVLDVDPRHGGDASLTELINRHGRLPETRTVLTGSGGRHFYFRYVSGVANSNSKIGRGLDVRGRRGYAIAPASFHKTMNLYKWQSEAPVADAPDWLITAALKARELSTQINLDSPRAPFVATPKRRWINYRGCLELLAPSDTSSAVSSAALGLPRVARAVPMYSREDKFALQAAVQSMLEIAATSHGARNDVLNSKAFALGRLMARGWIDSTLVYRALWRGARDCGLIRDDGADSVLRTMLSGAEAGLLKPYPDL